MNGFTIKIFDPTANSVLNEFQFSIDQFRHKFTIDTFAVIHREIFSELCYEKCGNIICKVVTV